MEVPYDIAVTYIGEIKGRIKFTAGMDVQKSGRTTEYTKGVVIDTNYNGSVSYSRGQAFFTDCYLVQGDKFSQGGDSGSPVCDMNSNYGGALFAGSDTHTIVCKLENIEQESDVTLVIHGE